MQHILLFLATLPILVLGDLLWVGVIASKFYDTRVGHLRGPVQWQGAVLFWLIYTLGILLFVVYPYMEDLHKTILFGALFGLVAYGVYNFTNYATLKNWTLTMTLVDIAWGMLLTTLVALSGHYLGRLFL